MTPGDDLIDRMAALKAARRPFVLATVIRTQGASAIKAGGKALIREDGGVEGWLGGACSDKAIKTAARDALADGQPRAIRISAAEPGPLRPEASPMREFKSGCQSGGVIEVFIEPMQPRPALYILGDTPTAEALAELGGFLDFAVTRAYPSAAEGLDGFDLEDRADLANASIVIATQGRRDTPALQAALATSAPYVAFVGSRRKSEKLKARLTGQGLAQERLARLRAPAGLDLGGRGPREIALSILAEIVQVRAARRGNADHDAEGAKA